MHDIHANQQRAVAGGALSQREALLDAALAVFPPLVDAGTRVLDALQALALLVDATVLLATTRLGRYRLPTRELFAGSANAGIGQRNGAFLLGVLRRKVQPGAVDAQLQTLLTIHRDELLPGVRAQLIAAILEPFARGFCA